jgi:3-hydroxyacyl-CoA dehydrogenase/enoyl-CoA hydratase/3-hydroxybutyryl-CoA epimerase
MGKIMETQNFQHFHWEKDQDGIVQLTLDRKNSSANSLSREVMEELNAVLDEVIAAKPIGMIIQSGKKNGFSPGADITQFTTLKNSSEAYDLIRQAQLVLDKLEALNFPTVAMVQGACLGGGYELALACRYIIAEDHEKTVIGLPEIKLGIHPGWGGTIRLPKRVGVMEAMKMILPGAAYPARKAAKIGVIDAAVPLRQLKQAARYYILKQPAPHQPGFIYKCAGVKWLRSSTGKLLYRGLKEQNVSPDHYPAPYAVVRNWVRDGAKGAVAYENEAKSIAELMMTDTARNLIRVFFLRTRLRSLAKETSFKASTVHVIGAGTMGGDIAAWCVFQGLNVTLQDQSPEKIAAAFKRAQQLFQKKWREERLVQAAMDRLMPDLTGMGLKQADVIIEAVFENLEVKQKIFQEIEEKAKPDAILATNTSSISLEKIAQTMTKPERLVGLHFFNPADKMPLVEVVRSEKTDASVFQNAVAFTHQIGRLPLPVKSSPGFLVNRILMPYLLEAIELYQEGVSPEVIDRAAKKFGMPMGPVELADRVGLDICLSAAEILMSELGGKIPDCLRQRVAKGELGLKTAKGFYTYKNGKPLKSSNPSEAKPVDLCDRMILRMLNEAMICLQEEIVADQDLLDAGMIFGTGFAPFRGGPLHYAKQRGYANIVEKLEYFTEHYGERFRPAVGWRQGC